MEFLKPHHRNYYLKRLSASFLYTYSGADLRQASSLPTVCIESEEETAATHVLQLHRQRIEAELEILTTQTLARSKRTSKYQAVTIPSSVKHQVTETPSAMARPRSPQRKNEESLQGLLDEQLAVIRQQLNSLSSERVKMEQRLEDLANGVKETLELSAHTPTRIVITGSTPGSIRRVHSMDSRKKQMLEMDLEQSLAKYKSAAYYQQMSTSPPLDEVDGEGWVNHQRFASVSSVGSSTSGYHRDSDAGSLTDSLGSSFLSPSTGPFHCRLHPPLLSEFADPIPELPESPSVSRSVTPIVRGAHSPLHRPRANSSTTPPSALRIGSPKHTRMHSQPSPTHPSLAQTLLSPSASGNIAASRPRSGSFSVLASPRLALKATLSSSDLRTRSNSSPAPPKRKSPSSSKLRHKKKDQQLSYFRKNSFTDLESSLKGSQTSIADEDECELKGSRDNVAGLGGGGGGFGEQPSPTGSAGRPSARILRRSSLTGQIEHVANSARAQVRRNNSFNASAITSVDGFKHAAVKGQRSLLVNKPRYSLTPTAPRRVVFLKSKETTV